MAYPANSSPGFAMAAAIALTCAVLPPAVAAESAGTLETASGRHRITVETAETPQARETGLMFRPSMPADQGMLFDFDQTRPVTMWMKNTYIPLDMLFMNEAGRVVAIKRDAQPQSLDLIPSGGPVRYVLELNAGAAARYGVAAGDRLLHPTIRPGG